MKIDLRNVVDKTIIRKKDVLEKLHEMFPDKNITETFEYPEIDQIELPLFTILDDECFTYRDSNNNVMPMFPNLELVLNLNKVIKVGNYCFYNCKKLKNKNDIFFCLSIGEYGFYNTNVKFQDFIGFDYIGKHSFENCTGLTSIRIDSLSEYAFANSSVKSVILPSGMEIPNNCFNGCNVEFKYV